MKRNAVKSRQWFETFFAGLYGRVLAGQIDPARTRRQARLIKRVLGLRKGQSALDCPCGQGRLTVPLARLGLKMTGVDLTRPFLAKARRAAGTSHVGVDFHHSDMRTLPFDGRFDAVINWFSSFGYFDDAGNLATARAAWASLKPGGQFLVEVINKSFLLSHWHNGRDEVINGVRIVNNHRMDRTSHVRDTWTMSRGGRIERRRLCMRVFNGTEMRALLKQAGFVDIRLLGHSAKGAGRFTRHSRRFIAVGRKPIG